LFVINRPSLVLVTIGVSAASAVGGIVWCLTGYAAAWLVSLSAAAFTGTEVRPGIGPTMVLAVAITLYLTLFAIQARQRRRFPRFEELEGAPRRRAASAGMARRTPAMVHDTVLNDLAVVMNAPDTLDPRTRERLREDLDTLAGGEWMRTTSQVTLPDEGQAVIRNRLARLASEFRWRGLTVNVTGVTDGVYIYDPTAGQALVDALRATLENVLRHAGSPVANVEIMYSDTEVTFMVSDPLVGHHERHLGVAIMYSGTEVTFMVSDEGVGFDPAAVEASRLGIRESVVGRMESVGGRARIWSAPGEGTTVLLSMPVLEVRDPGTPSGHQGAAHAD